MLLFCLVYDKYECPPVQCQTKLLEYYLAPLNYFRKNILDEKK